MLRSLVRSQPGAELRVHLLHGPDLTAGTLAPLKGMLESSGAELKTHRVPASDVAGLPAWGRIPQTMWYRIFLPRLLPDLDRVLYLDVDVVVVDSLAELFQIDLAGFYVGAVTNVPQRRALGHAEELGLPGPEHYFNSGVLLMNLALMRRDGCTETLLECAREQAPELLWPDQDALNMVLAGHRLPLHPRWNMMNSIRNFSWSRELLDRAEVERAIADPAIIHFEGPGDNKPWHILCEHPRRDAYLDCRRQTPWPRFRPEGITPANVIALTRRRLSAHAARHRAGRAVDDGRGGLA